MKLRTVFASLLLGASMIGSANAAEPVKLSGEELRVRTH
jgi:hypothetical protein